MDGETRTCEELVSDKGSALAALRLTDLQMEEIFYTLCGGSVHSHQNEIAAGYITLPDGCRAGIGGRFLEHPEQGVILQKLWSLNLRISRRKSVILPDKLQRLLDGPFTGLLLVGEPDSGKTTLLRSMARYLAQRHRMTAVIDERGELFPERKETLPVGESVDGGLEEVTALEQGLFSGVDFVATLHASSLEEACRRPQVQALRAADALRAMALLRGRTHPGQVCEVRML